MTTLPAAVGAPVDIELPRRDEHLLALPVELVAVDVEVDDLETGLLPLIDAEAGEHLRRVEQADVAQRLQVGRDLLGGQPVERHLPLLDLVERDAHRRPAWR